MLTRTTIFWLLSYVAVMAAIVAALLVTRKRVLARLDTPEARRQWQAWKEKTAGEQVATGPVRRRALTNDEPPALILLRDRFAAIVATTVMICSFLFAFLTFVARGAFRSGRPTS